VLARRQSVILGQASAQKPGAVIVCGIVAVVAPRGAVDRERLHRATLCLHHRGPDLQREWIADHGRAGLGHARLSIIDLTTGTQPIENESGHLHIVVNGEFYDFEAIRTGLEERGHRFCTRSDSEIALHLYEESGAGCLHRLRGEFAFALWDEREGTLFAGRDRFGIKPLYYTVHDGAFILASEVKALAAYGVPLRWDAETLYDMHSVVHAPDRSPFAGVYQVPPGCYLLTNGEHVRILPYWDFDYPTAAELQVPGNPEESVERLRHAFDEAVRLRMRADVPVACYLSGGIDSCAVLGVASKFAAQPIRAYTLSFDHAAYDERAIAEQQAALSGAEFFPIDIRSADLADHFADALYYAERPFVNGHTVAKYLLSRAVRDSGVRVVLTGEGSDEIFAGYPHFRRDMVLYNAESQDEESRRQLIAELDAANRVSQGLLLPDGRTDLAPDARRALGFVPSTVEIWAQMATAMKTVLHPDFAARFRERASLRMFFSHIDVERQLRGRDAVNQSLYVWAKTLLPNYILSNLGDRMEMAHSVEGRLPFLDHVVVEEVARMPVGLKIRGMTEKYVLREAARPVLTDAVYRRQKHPFLSPPSTLQREGSLYGLFQDTLRGSALDGPGIYDRRSIIAMLDSVDAMDEAGRTRMDPLLTYMTSLCLIHERMGVAGVA
jgi:asparagine synthase (glutamine-hydrolysing)